MALCNGMRHSKAESGGQLKRSEVQSGGGSGLLSRERASLKIRVSVVQIRPWHCFQRLSRNSFVAFPAHKCDKIPSISNGSNHCRKLRATRCDIRSSTKCVTGYPERPRTLTQRLATMNGVRDLTNRGDEPISTGYG